MFPKDKFARAASLYRTTHLFCQEKFHGSSRKTKILSAGALFLGAFTIGDQLLWGAAEPLRRMLRIVIEA